MKLDCGHESKEYGQDKDGKKYCYACCALRDKEQMRTTGKAVLYLTHDTYAGEGKTIFHGSFRSGKVTNWPGSLEIPCQVKRGSHNMAGTRYDVWFTFEGQDWYGVQYGENSQLTYCHRLKSKAA